MNLDGAGVRVDRLVLDGEQTWPPIPPPQTEQKIVTTLRFDADLLRLIDIAAKKRGVSRTAWVMMAASRAVEEGL